MPSWSCDFETTTNVNDCRVWAWAILEIGGDRYYTGNNIGSFISKVIDLGKGIYYFHNLKFDGEFILNYLFRSGFEWSMERKLQSGQIGTLITDRGVFYEIRFNVDGVTYTFRDSLKIIPLSVAEMSKAFGLKDEKLEIDYLADREEGHELTKQEQDYIHNDVAIVAGAINYMFRTWAK